MRSSGSFSIRMMMPTVPMAWMSSGSGFSTSKRFLRREEDHPIAGQRRFDGLDRHVPSDEQAGAPYRERRRYPGPATAEVGRGLRCFAAAENPVRLILSLVPVLRVIRL